MYHLMNDHKENSAQLVNFISLYFREWYKLLQLKIHWIHTKSLFKTFLQG